MEMSNNSFNLTSNVKKTNLITGAVSPRTIHWLTDARTTFILVAMFFLSTEFQSSVKANRRSTAVKE